MAATVCQEADSASHVRTPGHYCNDIACNTNCNAWCVCVYVRTYVHVYGPRNCLSLLYVSFIIALSFVCSTLIVCSLSLYLCVHCMNGI